MKAKTSSFDAVQVAKVQTELLHERRASNQCAMVDGYSSTTEELQSNLSKSGPEQHVTINNQPSFPESLFYSHLPSPIFHFLQPILRNRSLTAVIVKYTESSTDLDDELPDVKPLDWRSTPFPNIYDSTKIPILNSEFVSFSYCSIVP